MSPEEALELQDFVASRLTMFPDAEISVTARPGGAVIRVRLETDVDEFEIEDDEVERYWLQISII